MGLIVKTGRIYASPPPSPPHNIIQTVYLGHSQTVLGLSIFPSTACRAARRIKSQSPSPCHFVCVMPVLPSNHKIAITPAICNEESPYQEPVWTTFPKHMSNPEEQGLVIIPIFTIHFKLFYRIESIYTRTLSIPIFTIDFKLFYT